MKLLKLYKRTQYTIFDGFGFPFESDKLIDLAYSNQLMEHLHPEDAIEQVKDIHRILKKVENTFVLHRMELTGHMIFLRFYGNDLNGIFI